MEKSLKKELVISSNIYDRLDIREWEKEKGKLEMITKVLSFYFIICFVQNVRRFWFICIFIIVKMGLYRGIYDEVCGV